MNRPGQWLEAYRQSCDMTVTQIPWSDSGEWVYDSNTISHRSGGFFRIQGITTSFGNGVHYRRIEQPIIDQPEIGILGFLIRKNEKDIEILVQAKPEPGNIGIVQAAPSVQATESNYNRIHKGKATLFLQHFLDNNKYRVISDSLQSEQGSRFLAKYNRNMIVEVNMHEVPEISPKFLWCPVRSLCELLKEDYQVNTDARSVLVSGSWQSLCPENKPFNRWRGKGGIGEQLLQSYEADDLLAMHKTNDIFCRLKVCRQEALFKTELLALNELSEWNVDSLVIQSRKADHFAIKQYRVKSSEREVSNWDQPLVSCEKEYEIYLIAQKKNGLLHFLFNCKPEIGFQECCQFGPSTQQPFDEFPGNIEKDAIEAQLLDSLSESNLLLSVRQSDEGGRFYQCRAHYCIHLLSPEQDVNIHDYMCWMTINQIEKLVKYQGVFTNEARSMISLLLTYL